jgi:pyridoxine 4-dehydrogenase
VSPAPEMFRIGGGPRGGPTRLGRRQVRRHPEALRSNCEESLQRLRLDRIDLYQLHGPDPAVPIAESVGELTLLQEEGNVRHIGLSNVSVEPLSGAGNRCHRLYPEPLQPRRPSIRGGIAFLPWNPLAIGRLAEPGGRLARVAQGTTPYARPGCARLASALVSSRAPNPGDGPLAAAVETPERLLPRRGAAGVSVRVGTFVAR